MSFPAAIGWDQGLTMSWKKPKKDEEEGWSWSYRDDFLPLLVAACPPKGYLRFFGTLPQGRE